jgi:hypothetical protein
MRLCMVGKQWKINEGLMNRLIRNYLEGLFRFGGIKSDDRVSINTNRHNI